MNPPAPIEFSNAIRLSGREWIGVALFAVFLVVAAPLLSKQFEPLTLEPDYRIPHDLSNDYWLFETVADLAARRQETLILGDSVVWGEYARRHETLSAYLNKEAGKEQFANLGLDGAHPLALSGLIRHYAGSVAGRNVVVECNPLWLSSPQADLQDDRKTNQFNHPRLIPQFWPHVPSYREEISQRLGIVVERNSPFSKWTTHLQQAYYGQSDLPSWTLEHPYENPLQPLMRGLPSSGDELRHLQQPWTKSGIKQQDYPWVDPGDSLQWRAFQEVVELLQARGNRVFVIVGPFNEHLLTEKSRGRYRNVKATIAGWLKEQRVAHLVPEPLPSEQYGDASHPLPEGYRALAHRLHEELSLQSADVTERKK